ncbi:hypothetical protein Hanom_Chr12g01179211 [Helianthus anomalus]
MLRSVEMDLRSWLFLYLSSISTPFIQLFFILFVHSSIQKPEAGPPKQHKRSTRISVAALF